MEHSIIKLKLTLWVAILQITESMVLLIVPHLLLYTKYSKIMDMMCTNHLTYPT